MRTALSIASSDPTGGAGLQADLQVFRKLGLHGAGVVTALTIQDSHKVHRVLPVFPSVVLDQLRTLLSDIEPSAIKIGALGSDDVVRSVELALEPVRENVPWVLDPILFSSSGAALLERRAWGSLQRLMEGCSLVTPNLPEAAALSGIDVSTASGAEAAARYFLEEVRAAAVLITGGHRSGNPDDLLAVRDHSQEVAFEWLPGQRIDGGAVHGTGCALSSAIAAGLANGQTLRKAIDEARSFVAAAIAAATRIGGGTRFPVYP
jgi:hydroxymethylpyrimidine kinase/phosphomethylpyrimidine kinase